MSATPHTSVPHSLDGPVPMTLPRLAEKKALSEPIVMVTAYDFPSAQVAQETALGGYRAQGRTAEQAIAVARDAMALEEAGCFAIVLEAIPAAVAEEIMARVEIPVIGIGAGPTTDGQVLVFHDLLGIYDGHVARFVKRYGEVKAQMVAGLAEYADDVRRHAFPGPEHTYTIDDEQLEIFRAALGR